MKKLQEIDESKMVLNPFLGTLQIEATKLTDSNIFIIDEDGIPVPASNLIEKQKFTKVYHCTGCKERVYNLSPSAKSLYLYLIYNVDANKEWLRINVDWYMKKNGVKSINTYKTAMRELCRYMFIHQSPDYKDVFWVNPELFFHGNRITRFPNNVIVKGEFSK